ncbi:hypothetical protein FF1_035620 [Malus domestica]
MLVDGEACTLPQLELLEATARTIQPMLEWGGSGLAVSDGLSNLLKCRPPGYHPLQISSSTEIASSVARSLRLGPIGDGSRVAKTDDRDRDSSPFGIVRSGMQPRPDPLADNMQNLNLNRPPSMPNSATPTVTVTLPARAPPTVPLTLTSAPTTVIANDVVLSSDPKRHPSLSSQPEEKKKPTALDDSQRLFQRLWTDEDEIELL